MAADTFRLPDWPSLMRPQMAAAYVDVSTTTFRQVIAPQIPAVRVTDRITAYMRTDLDAWMVARRDGDHPAAPVPNPWHERPGNQVASIESSASRPPRRCSTDIWHEESGFWVRPPARNYPVSALERRLLAHLSDGLPAGLPKGVSIGTVDRLADRGWIEQVKHYDDGRRNTYVLTEAGMAQASSLDAPVVA